MVKDADQPDRSATDAMGRNVWDKEYFSAKAKKRAEEADNETDKDKFVPIPVSEREYLRGRNADLKLTANLNKFKVITDQTSKDQRGGYWCNVCECLLKDSQVYLDHINGRPHNRRLGMTMKVEKVGVEDVKAKLASLRKGGAAKPEESPKTDEPPVEGLEARLARLEEEQRLKKERKKEKKRKKDTRHRDGDDRFEEPDFLADDVPAGEESVAKKIKVDDDTVEPEASDCAQKNDDARATESDKTEDVGESDDDGTGMSAEDIAAMKAMGLPVGFS